MCCWVPSEGSPHGVLADEILDDLLGERGLRRIPYSQAPMPVSPSSVWMRRRMGETPVHAPQRHSYGADAFQCAETWQRLSQVLLPEANMAEVWPRPCRRAQRTGLNPRAERKPCRPPVPSI
jgi:hypothetical protein